MRYALIPARWQTSKHAANRVARSLPPMRVREAPFSVKRGSNDETENSALLPLALHIFRRYIALTLRPMPSTGLPRGRKRMRRGGRVVDCTALEMRSTFTGTVGSNPTLSAKLYPTLRLLISRHWLS